MTLSSGAKFRCYPTPDQIETLTSWMGCQRYVYNAKVGEYRYFKAFRNNALSQTGIPIPVDQQYSHFKDRGLTPFLFSVPSQVLRNGATRFMVAYRRFTSGLANPPAFKKNRGRQSVWLTSELFRLGPAVGGGKRKDVPAKRKLILGTRGQPLGELKFKAHTGYGAPASITISRDNGRWFVSFSYETAGDEMSPEYLMRLYGQMSRQELEPVCLGLDRGVCTPVAASSGERYGFKESEISRTRRKERRRKKYQRMMTRRAKGSGSWKRALYEAAKSSRYMANVREDFAHQISRKLVDGSAEIIFFEDLNVKGMTAKPRPKPGRKGSYLPNGAKAKAGLTRAILDSAWGKVKTFTSYKAKKLNKLVLSIPPHGTSQECSHCGRTHPDNRPAQAKFECKNCGHTENADVNAARVIKIRGINRLIAGEFTVGQKKRAMRLKKKAPLGQELPDVMRGEESVRRHIGDPYMPQTSLNRETPTTIMVTI